MGGPLKLLMLCEIPGVLLTVSQESTPCGSIHGAIQELQDPDCGVNRPDFGKYFPCLLYHHCFSVFGLVNALTLESGLREAFILPPPTPERHLGASAAGESII